MSKFIKDEKGNIIIDFTSNLIEDMSVSKVDAIDTCMNYAPIFIEHFEKIVDNGLNDKYFSYHCNEMQAWYDKVRKIKLKMNNKVLTKTNLIDWFFTGGAEVMDYMKNPTDEKLDLYEDFYIKLLDSNLKIEEVLKSIL